MERLKFLGALVLGSLLAGCQPAGFDAYHRWDDLFSHQPQDLDKVATALWISRYTLTADQSRFLRTVSWGSVPEKLDADGDGGYTIAVPLVRQAESSEGPLPDEFWTVVVRVQKIADRFVILPNDALPGTVVGWQDQARRTVWFRGKTPVGSSNQVLWQFHGRY